MRLHYFHHLFFPIHYRSTVYKLCLIAARYYQREEIEASSRWVSELSYYTGETRYQMLILAKEMAQVWMNYQFIGNSESSDL